ncbi:MAG: hypothetical protein IJ192_07210 [Clostridia bacterium]|nr:hypothetical protein [Clostridia bacterium]
MRFIKSNGDSVKKLFPYIGAVMIFGCGLIIHFSYIWSDKAAWSLIISSVNNSAWEIYKPFGLVYINWIIIELSCLRPSLLHFVCSKLIGMYVLCATVLSVSMLFHFLPQSFSEYTVYAAGGLGILLAQIVGYRLYASKIRSELFYVPLILSLMAMVFLIIILTFYPPKWGVFYDFVGGFYGRVIHY